MKELEQAFYWHIGGGWYDFRVDGQCTTERVDYWDEWCEECSNTESPCIHTLEKIYGGDDA